MSAAPARAATPAAVPVRLQAAPGPPTGGLSIYWLVVPEALFVFLDRTIFGTAITLATAAVLWMVRNGQIAPNADWYLKLQPYRGLAPALQIPVILVMLGASLFTVGIVIAGAAAAIFYHREVIHTLEPWWKFQASVPGIVRRVLAFVIPAAVGYYFGRRAGGAEWTMTIWSMSIGISIAVLLNFTPPNHLRRRA